MQSTGQTSTQELSFVPMQGSAITYAIGVSSGSGRARARDEVSAVHDLDPGAPLWLSEGALVSVDPLPSCVVNAVAAALFEQGVEVVSRRGVELPCLEVGQQRRDRLVGALLVGADDARRSALDPARGVHAGRDAPALVGDRRLALVERHPGYRGAGVPDRPQHQVTGKRVGL